MAVGVSANRLELLSIADAVAREKMIDREIVIEATPDEVMAVLFDLESLTEWSSAHQRVEVLEDALAAARRRACARPGAGRPGERRDAA